MALKQKYGIAYPFSNNNLDNVYMDVNESFADGIKSQVMHLILTPRGRVLRNPDFGTDLIKYIFSPKDEDTFSDVKKEISSQIVKYIPNVVLEDISVFEDENDEHGIIVSVTYSVRRGNKAETTTVAVKI